MSDELLAAICAAPDDDAPRLVLADRLLESANERDRRRGEFIIAQCTLAREPRGSDAWKRARGVERRLQASIEVDDTTPGRVYAWARGFPSAVSIDPRELRQGAFARRPALSTLSLPSPTLGDLAWVRRQFPHLRKLSITAEDGSLSLDPSHLPALQESDETPAWEYAALPNPCLRHIITRLSVLGEDDTALDAYIGLPLPALEELAIPANDLDRAMAVLEHRRLRDLTCLGGSDPRDLGLALVRSGVLARLEALDADVDLGPELVRAIVSSRIVELSLVFDGDGLAPLARGIASRVRRLHLTNLGNTRVPIAALTGVCFPALDTLHLRYFDLDESTTRLDLPALGELELSNCLVDPRVRPFVQRLS